MNRQEIPVTLIGFVYVGIRYCNNNYRWNIILPFCKPVDKRKQIRHPFAVGQVYDFIPF